MKPGHLIDAPNGRIDQMKTEKKIGGQRPAGRHKKNRGPKGLIFSSRGQRTRVANRPRGRGLDVSRNITFWGLCDPGYVIAHADPRNLSL